MTENTAPRLLEFKKIGEPITGFISVAECEKDVPFVVKRVFWTYFTPESITRGRHAHHCTEMVLVAVAGRISVTTETAEHGVGEFLLERPDMGLYLPTYCWHTMRYSHNAVQLVMASTMYDPSDYIRSYEAFKTHTKPGHG